MLSEKVATIKTLLFIYKHDDNAELAVI